MTENKLIIIDGVDVSECCNAEQTATTPKCTINDWIHCDGQDCYFKRLARKTQECEKKSWEIGNLGYKIKNQRKEINERLKQLKAKEQECEELKNIINEAENSGLDLKSFLISEVIQKEYEEQIDKLKVKNEQYKEEIMLLRKGYDKEDCTKTCPNMQIYERELKQAEQKLERIRELLTNITEAGLCEAKECGCDDNKECLECTLNEIKDIIQIIDEVER